jgi:hypothetical protein
VSACAAAEAARIASSAQIVAKSAGVRLTE